MARILFYFTYATTVLTVTASNSDLSGAGSSSASTRSRPNWTCPPTLRLSASPSSRGSPGASAHGRWRQSKFRQFKLNYVPISSLWITFWIDDFKTSYLTLYNCISRYKLHLMLCESSHAAMRIISCYANHLMPCKAFGPTRLNSGLEVQVHSHHEVHTSFKNPAVTILTVHCNWSIPAHWPVSI